ncbi:uncharacterized protein [Periplaneta americana]|uniref:uncharacterized protein n=1 Tax=Periplaneta americana TaxID=6978 RepID=UPI0037E745C6
MEVKAPSWLNAELLQTALKSASDADVNVISFEVKSATAAGDNYASDMFRVTVYYTQGDVAKNTSLVIKAVKQFHDVNQMVSEGKAFDREIKAFTHILPAIHRLLRDIFPREFQPLGAKLHYCYKGPSACALVLEDLKDSGFKMAERTRGLDMSHSLLVMKYIGRYHAASIALHEKEPEKFQVFTESIFSAESKETMENLFNATMRNVAREVEKWPDYNERFASKLHKLADDAYMLYVNALKRDEEEFNVLCHGDLWLNNMMFRYSEETGEVVDVRFVDYQICHWTSPAIDLQYFFHTSLSSDLIDKQHILVQEYYNSLVDALTKLGYKHFQPTMSQLEKQLEKRGLYGLLTSCTILPITLADRSNVPDLMKILTKENEVHLSEVYMSVMRKFLPVFEKRGCI